MKATYLSIEPHFRQATNEEGRYDYVAGYDVHAAVPAERDGRKGTEHYYRGHLFTLRQDAEKFVTRADGQELNPELWDLVSEDFRTTEDRIYEDQLLAYRERNGELL